MLGEVLRKWPDETGGGWEAMRILVVEDEPLLAMLTEECVAIA